MGIGAAHDQDAGRQAGLVRDGDARDERAHAEADQGDALWIDIGLGLRPIDHAPDVDHGADEPADHLLEQLEELRFGAGVATASQSSSGRSPSICSMLMFPPCFLRPAEMALEG